MVKLKKGKFLVLIVSVAFIVCLSIILASNFTTKEQINYKVDDKGLVERNYKSNLIIEDDNSNVVETNEEAKGDGSTRITPNETMEGVMSLPNPDINEEVILRKL